MATSTKRRIRLQERELVFEFVGALDAKVFDGPTHGLSHCMKAVDFIVEVKDPDHSHATPERRAKFTEELIPLQGPAGWARGFARGVVVLNMKLWNANGAYGSVRRVLGT